MGEANSTGIIEYWSGSTLVGRSTEAAPAGVELRLPDAKSVPVRFRTSTHRDNQIVLGPTKVGSLTLRLRLVQKTPSLVERVLEVSADTAQRFAITFPLEVAWTVNSPRSPVRRKPARFTTRCEDRPGPRRSRW